MPFVQPAWSSIFPATSVGIDIDPTMDWYKGPGWYESKGDWLLVEDLPTPVIQSTNLTISTGEPVSARVRVHCWYGKDPRAEFFEMLNAPDHSSTVNDRYFEQSLRPHVNGRLGGLLWARSIDVLQVLARELDGFCERHVRSQSHQLYVVRKCWRAFLRELQALVALT